MNYTEEKIKEICIASVIGAASGDAMGVPYEFLSREETRRVYSPYMMGNDTNISFTSKWSSLIPSGSWSDDTSMLIATMQAITERQGEIDYRLIMNHFVDWWTKAQFCSWIRAFGLGGCVSKSLQKFNNGTDPLECGGRMMMDNGNGSLMRILPFSLLAVFKDMNLEGSIALVSNGSSLTHAHEVSCAGCCIFTEFLRQVIMGKDKYEAVQSIQQIDFSRFFGEQTLREYEMVLKQPYETWREENIKETGYVVDTLNGALFSIMNSDSFENAINIAIRLGGDTDTVACVTGALAGTIYGYSSIPEKWICNLCKFNMLRNIALGFARTITNMLNGQ